MRATTIQRKMNTQKTIEYAETHNTPAPIFPEDLQTMNCAIPTMDLEKIPNTFTKVCQIPRSALDTIPRMPNPWALFWAREDNPMTSLLPLITLYRKTV